MSISQNPQNLFHSKAKLVLYIFLLIISTAIALYLNLNPSAYDGRFNAVAFILIPLSFLFFLGLTIFYILLLVSGKPLIQITDEELSISKGFKTEVINWSEVAVISKYQVTIPNPGSYGITKIKNKYVEILTKDGKKHHISAIATGKSVDELLDWIKQTCLNYPNLQNIVFADKEAK